MYMYVNVYTCIYISYTFAIFACTCTMYIYACTCMFVYMHCIQCGT